MKMILAVVQPFMLERVIAALHEIPEVTGATFTPARGFGRGRSSDVAESEVLYGTAEKMRVEVVVRDDDEEMVVRAIRDAAHTGHRGDGKVFVLPLGRAMRIAAPEEGEDAV